MRLELGTRGYPVDDFLREEIRLDAGNAVAVDTFHFVKRLQQIQERFSCAASEIAGVHSG